MSEAFNVNEYWLKRGRDYISENFPASFHRLQEKFLLDTLEAAQIPFERILEIGCGFGRITRLLAEKYPSAALTAVDLSEEQLKNARRYCAARDNIQFASYDFYSGAPLPGGRHDLVIAIEVFLHHPETLLRSLLQRLALAAPNIVNVDWSEDWPWPRPEHVWIHDYSVLYRALGLEVAALPLPERVNGLQQRLFWAGRTVPDSIRALHSEAAPVSALPPEGHWQVQLQHALADIRLFVPESASLILINENQWGSAEADLQPRRVLPFLERSGQYWGFPADDPTAIAELTRMRTEGATHIALAWHSFWWLEHYTDFARFLRSGCSRLIANDRVVIYKL